MLSVVMMVYISETVRELVLERFGIDASDHGYRKWVVRTRQLYGKAMTNGLAVCDKAMRYIYSRK